MPTYVSKCAMFNPKLSCLLPKNTQGVLWFSARVGMRWDGMASSHSVGSSAAEEGKIGVSPDGHLLSSSTSARKLTRRRSHGMMGGGGSTNGGMSILETFRLRRSCQIFFCGAIAQVPALLPANTDLYPIAS